MAALTDCCAFGERTLADASLACMELAAVVGIRHDPHSFAPSGALDDFTVWYRRRGDTWPPAAAPKTPGKATFSHSRTLFRRK